MPLPSGAVPGLLLALLAGAASAQPLTPAPGPSAAVADVERSAVAWGDLDGDGTPDLVVTGATASGRAGQVLRGGPGGFVAAGTVTAVDLGAAAWADLDGDGLDDLALIGTTDDAQTAMVGEVYRSTGAGLVRDAANSAALPDLHAGALAWGDLDGDGDPDLVVTGAADDRQTDTRGLVFRNEGGALTLDAASSAAVADVSAAALALVDLDGDGDLDLALTGFDGAYEAVGEAYRNDGGTLVRQASWSAALPDVGAGALAAGDLDGDGDPDLVVTGGRVEPDGRLVLVGEVLRTDGGVLTRDEARSAAVPDVFFSAAALADVDGDGDADLAVSGLTAATSAAGLFRSGPGALTFEGAWSADLPAVFYAALAFADADGDGDPDLLVAGATDTGRIGLLLVNQRPPPQPPIAQAGPDQQAACAGPSGTSFALDGSASTDPEGAPLAYAWTGPFTEGGGTAEGVDPVVSFPSGSHVVTLTVTDLSGLSASDAVTMEVTDGTAPTVARLGAAAVAVTRFSGPFDDPGAEADDACDGPLTPVVEGAVDTTLPGVYTLTYVATDRAGNAAQTTRTVAVEDVTVPLLSPYAALAGSKLEANKQALLTGDLHANDRLRFRRGLQDDDGGPSRVLGSVTSSREVRVENRQVIDGDVTAPKVEVKNGGVVTGTITEAAVPEVPLPTVTVTGRSTVDVEVDEGQTLVLPPGIYDVVEVKKDAILVLGSGDYVFRELDIDDRARLDVQLTTGPTDIGIHEDLKVGKDAIVGPVPAGGADARFLTFRVAGRRVDVDDRSQVAAQIVAPDADVRLQKDVRMVGLLVGDEVDLQDRVELTFLSDGTVPNGTDGGATSTEPPADAARLSAAAAALAAPYPNPARAAATVPFTLRDGAHVRLSVHDALGREVAVLADGPTAAGRHTPRLDGASLPAGVYLVRLVADGTLADAGRLTLVR